VLECLHVWEHLFIHPNHTHVAIVEGEPQNGQAIIVLQVLHLNIVSVVDIAKLFVHIALLLLLMMMMMLLLITLLLITLQFALNSFPVWSISNTG
jgi:hypothetical protein